MAQSSLVPDLEIILEVNLNFRVRHTIILTCGIFFRVNGSGSSLLKYIVSNPSLLKISVELDRQINLKQFCVICTFLQTVLVYFEIEFDSNCHMLHNGKADLWQWNPQCKIIKKWTENSRRFNFGVFMLRRRYWSKCAPPLVTNAEVE